MRTRAEIWLEARDAIHLLHREVTHTTSQGAEVGGGGGSGGGGAGERDGGGGGAAGEEAGGECNCLTYADVCLRMLPYADVC